MKKLFLLLMVASLGIAGTATAQKRSNNKCGNGNNKHSKKYDRRDDDRYDRNDTYSNNAPRKVRDAFYRDYPNASAVNWTKDRGVWTANFKRGIFNSNTSVSYRANGERVGSDNGIFGKRDDRTARNPGIFDKVRKNQ